VQDMYGGSMPAPAGWPGRCVFSRGYIPSGWDPRAFPAHRLRGQSRDRIRSLQLVDWRNLGRAEAPRGPSVAGHVFWRAIGQNHLSSRSPGAQRPAFISGNRKARKNAFGPGCLKARALTSPRPARVWAPGVEGKKLPAGRAANRGVTIETEEWREEKLASKAQACPGRPHNDQANGPSGGGRYSLGQIGDQAWRAGDP